MTQLLEKALEEVRTLTEPEQDAIATLILEELRAEQQWQAAFARSQEKLAGLAAEALEEHRAGRTRELDPDSL